jgi:hypothetical protein
MFVWALLVGRAEAVGRPTCHSNPDHTLGYLGAVTTEAAQHCVSVLLLINQPPGSLREPHLAASSVQELAPGMPQDAPWVAGWAQDASVLACGFARRARGLPVPA